MVAPRKPRMRKAKKSVKPRKANKGLNPIQKKQVMNILVKKAETKYVVSLPQGELEQSVGTQITTPGAWKAVLPDLAEGTANNQRIGERVSNIRGKTTMYFNFPKDLAKSSDVFVKIFYGTHKSAKTQEAFLGIPPNTLLEVGNQSTVDWDIGVYNSFILNMMPISYNSWTLKSKTIRLHKNAGVSVGDAALSPNISSNTSHTFAWHWNHPAQLHYTPNGATPNLPTNYYPVFCAVAWSANNQEVFASNYTYRNEMYFEDI